MKTKRRFTTYLSLLLLLLLIALFAEYFAPHDPYAQNLALSLEPPSATFPLGTDRYGRCVLSRIIAGSTISIYASLLLVLLTASLGTLVGLAAALLGKRADNLLMRTADCFLAFPGLVLALAIASIHGGGLLSAGFALIAIAWPKYARLMRAKVLVLKQEPFIIQAPLWGYSKTNIFFKHLLPVAIGPILTMGMLDIGTMMLELAALSFLGLGVQPPTIEWGSMLTGARSLMQIAPWTIFSPMYALILTVTLFNLLGKTLRQLLELKHL